jgi:hypothetical protein
MWALSLAHRYLGISWVSDVDVVPVRHRADVFLPTLSQSPRLSGLAPIDGTYCTFPQGDFLFGGWANFFEMLGPDPVLRLPRDEENAAAISVT